MRGDCGVVQGWKAVGTRQQERGNRERVERQAKKGEKRNGEEM